MSALLTRQQLALVIWLGGLHDSHVELYVEDSLNGLSWTLRYRRRWADPGGIPRSSSHMILAVRKPEDAKCDSKVYAERMGPRVAEARRVFEETIKARSPG